MKDTLKSNRNHTLNTLLFNDVCTFFFSTRISWLKFNCLLKINFLNIFNSFDVFISKINFKK
jgi:hypothetical protein